MQRNRRNNNHQYARIKHEYPGQYTGKTYIDGDFNIIKKKMKRQITQTCIPTVVAIRDKNEQISSDVSYSEPVPFVHQTELDGYPKNEVFVTNPSKIVKSNASPFSANIEECAENTVGTNAQNDSIMNDVAGSHTKMVFLVAFNESLKFFQK